MIRSVFLAALTALFLFGCSEELPTYRYRLTVEVDTPEGVVSGSAVREVSSSCSTRDGYAGGGASMDVRGEAVAVDLPNGETLFALLSAPTYNGEAAHVAFNVFLRQITKGRGFSDSCEHLNYTVKALASGDYRAEVPEDMYPTFVRFNDLKDPMSVQKLEAGSLEGSFDKNFRVRRILILTTDANPTAKIVKILPWLCALNGGYIDGGFTNRSTPLGLTGRAFKGTNCDE